MQCRQAFIHSGNAAFTANRQRHQLSVCYLAMSQDPFGGNLFEVQIIRPEFMFGHSANRCNYTPSLASFDSPAKPQLESDQCALGNRTRSKFSVLFKKEPVRRPRMVKMIRRTEGDPHVGV